MDEKRTLDREKILAHLKEASRIGKDFKLALSEATVGELEEALGSLTSDKYPHGFRGDKGRIYRIRKRIIKLRRNEADYRG